MDPARAYKEAAVRTATPVGLVVMLYGGAIQAIQRATAAMREGSVERRTAAIDRLLAIVDHLQLTLDRERGGEVAAHLDVFYNYARSRALQASMHQSEAILMELTGHLSSLREAWQQVERETAASPNGPAAAGLPAQIPNSIPAPSSSAAWRG